MFDLFKKLWDFLVSVFTVDFLYNDLVVWLPVAALIMYTFLLLRRFFGCIG